MPCKPDEVIKIVSELLLVKDISPTDIPEYMKEIHLNLSTCSVGKKGKKDGPKRPLSAYNLHMQSCAKGGKGKWKPCIDEWNRLKGK